MPELDARKPLVVGLGEALFDCFPNHVALGGAPVNVSVHANALLSQVGGSALPLTRVGDDELGERFYREIADRGVSTDYVQRDPQRQTGRVNVTLDDEGHASYVFEPDGAWDAIAFSPHERELAESCSAVAFGTLAQRSELSRRSIHAFLEAAKDAVRLFDVNLRQQYYSREVLEASLRVATATKLNEEELDTVLETLRLDTHGSVAEKAARLAELYALEWVAVTQGSLGTAVHTGRVWHEAAPQELDPDPDADTVGAGDSCCAALLTGALLGWPVERTLTLANTIGAYVASRAGATPPLSDEILGMVRAAS